MSDSGRPGAAGPEIFVEISAGELLDKITILELKLERIEAPQKRRNVSHELERLVAARARVGIESAALEPLVEALRVVNSQLWGVEEALRDCERKQEFGPKFIELARAVYRANDERANIKRSINMAVGSDIIEEKSYGVPPGSDGSSRR